MASKLSIARDRQDGTAKLRILEILGNAMVGGVEQSTLNLLGFLDKERFETACLCPYESAFTAALRALGCEVWIAPVRDDPPWRAIETAAAMVAQKRIDLIHAHLFNAQVLATLVGKLTAIPVVVTAHSMELSVGEISVARLSHHHLVTVCRAAFAQCTAAGLDPDALSLIPNGVDVARFRPDRSGAAFRESIGVPPEAPLVGYVGRLSFEKGPDKFIKAAIRILNANAEAHCVLVGEGPEEQELRRMVRELDQDGRIHFAGCRERTEEVYPALDVFVQTSRVEGTPLALLEAMSCGRPVVALAIGGVAEVIEAGTSGIQISPVDWPGVASPYSGDWPGVADAVLHLLAQPDLRREMGARARERVVKEFSLARRGGEMQALLLRLASLPRVAVPKPG